MRYCERTDGEMKKKRRGTVYKTEKKQREYASTNMAAEAHMHADTTGEIKELSSSECPSSHSPPSYFFPPTRTLEANSSVVSRSTAHGFTRSRGVCHMSRAFLFYFRFERCYVSPPVGRILFLPGCRFVFLNYGCVLPIAAH